MSDIILKLSNQKAVDIAELIKLYLQYLQYLKPVTDAAKYQRLLEVKQELDLANLV